MAKVQVVGDVLSELAWRTLREQSGVTYGAGAYPVQYLGETNASWLIMSSLTQNSAAGYAVEVMFDIIDKGVNGEVSEESIAAAKWNIGRQYVLGQQSGYQMMNRLATVGVGNYDFFDQYPVDLGEVTRSAFGEILETCPGHEVVTIVGPKEFATAQLDERGIAYEVVDWEALYFTELTPREQRKYLERKAAEAEEEARRQAEESGEEG